MATTAITPRKTSRPTWAEVSLANLKYNFSAVQTHVGVGVRICAVVKADAYGHGAVECARALRQEGATWFGVTSLDEAIPLRDAGVSERILLMTGFWPGEEEEVVRLGLTPIIWDANQINLLERAAQRLGVRRHCVHLKVDTGMGRLGAAHEDLPRLCSLLHTSSRLQVEALSTHLASSEILDAASVEEQLKRFEAARRVMQDRGLDPEFHHIANTGAVISQPQSWQNMVRPGLALYGYSLPFQRNGENTSTGTAMLNVKPVLTWRTRILALRNVPANQALGYGGTFITKDPSRIAVLPVGYADGLNRQLSSRGRVIVRGCYAPIVGRISMDLTMVDVTAIPEVSAADEVVLLGDWNELTVDAGEHARVAGTTPYEILCSISKRVPRSYTD